MRTKRFLLSILILSTFANTTYAGGLSDALKQEEGILTNALCTSYAPSEWFSEKITVGYRNNPDRDADGSYSLQDSDIPTPFQFECANNQVRNLANLVQKPKIAALFRKNNICKIAIDISDWDVIPYSNSNVRVYAHSNWSLSGLPNTTLSIYLGISQASGCILIDETALRLALESSLSARP